MKVHIDTLSVQYESLRWIIITRLLPFPSPQMDYSVSESQTSTCLARNVPSLQPRGKFGWGDVTLAGPARQKGTQLHL